MPKRRVTWSSWNYQTITNSRQAEEFVSLTYWMNRLQPFMPQKDNIFVTLNPLHEPRKGLSLGEFHYEHPVYTADTILSQKELPSIQGKANTWFAGAWTNFGFHEDGLTSGLKVAQGIGAKIPFPIVDATHIRPLKAKL
jgi:predicted NAD/FAD-binding protein